MSEIEKEKEGVKTFLETEFVKGFEVDEKIKDKYKARININSDKGERIYYIGIWDAIKILAKINLKEEVTFTVTDMQSNTDWEDVGVPKSFNRFIDITTEILGTPNYEERFENCKTVEDTIKILNKDNIIEGDEDGS